jgi:hypothetical protein
MGFRDPRQRSHRQIVWSEVEEETAKLEFENSVGRLFVANNVCNWQFR